MSEDIPEDMPDRMPEDMPEDMPGRMPEDMPDRMPEDMSDRMPEDLPVTKRINVMVGITRSKVIFILCSLSSFYVHPAVLIQPVLSFPAFCSSFLFPTCQVRVVRFYVSCPARLLRILRRLRHRTSTASS